MVIRTFLNVAMMGLLACGCGRGFKSADDLAQDKRGPRECEASCSELGMHMSAFVLFELEHSGCVCSPGAGKHADLADDGATPVAAGHAVLMEKERQRQEQARQAQQSASQSSY